VQYLIFELADNDVRAHLENLTRLDAVFIMKTLHHVASGLAQLHREGIAHQDLKPSNVLIYSANKGAKVCDLGRAWDRNESAEHDNYPIPGDPKYAPVEFFYNSIAVDDRVRRYGCDLYHLGSLLVFCFTNVHTNGLLADALNPAHRPMHGSDAMTKCCHTFKQRLSQC
jgi:serine/threonine protein kinase